MTEPESQLQNRLKSIPKVDLLARHSSLDGARARLGEAMVTRGAREVVSRIRASLLAGGEEVSLDEAAASVAALCELASRAGVRRVINGTGVVLHTNLGRAPLSNEAAARAADVARGYDTIELDLESGRRGARGGAVERLLTELTDSESAVVVNNNAAAVLLALTALASGRTVLVSRGELVEIGGGFRIPDVLSRSGAKMVEVGTTNRTRLEDYAKAMDEHDDVAAILSVHTGNFRISGFAESPSLAELAALAEARGVLLIDDLGGGALLDLDAFAGLRGEPVARERVNAGAHVVCFSCDKVLGGPQAGAVVGRAGPLARIARDPLFRAVRVGPVPMAALEATLEHYQARRFDEVPVLAMMRRSTEEVRARVERWQARLSEQGFVVETVGLEGRVGGGTFAEEPLPSAALRLSHATWSADEIARRLRTGASPVLPRVVGGSVHIDGRTVLDDEDDALVAAIAAAMAGGA